jgi:hypothetical protein
VPKPAACTVGWERRESLLPEARVTPEVGEAGIDAHPSPGRDEEAIRSGDYLGRALDIDHAVIVEHPGGGRQGHPKAPNGEAVEGAKEPAGWH